MYRWEMWAKNGWTVVANEITKAYGKAGNGEYLIRILVTLVNIWISNFLSWRKQFYEEIKSPMF